MSNYMSPSEIPSANQLFSNQFHPLLNFPLMRGAPYIPFPSANMDTHQLTGARSNKK